MRRESAYLLDALRAITELARVSYTADERRGARTPACRVETHLDAWRPLRHSVASRRRQEWRRGTQECVRHVTSLKIYEECGQEEFVAQPNRERFLEDRMQQSFVFHRLVILGEAAGALAKPFQEKYPELRNRLVHAYFDPEPAP